MPAAEPPPGAAAIHEETSRALYPGRARALLEAGRGALESQGREAARPLFAAAAALDPRVFCLPWGLLPRLEAEGRGNFRDRMRHRLATWHRAPESPAHAAVVALTRSKTRTRDFARGLGLQLPEDYARAPSLAALDIAALPDRVVIKPQNAASSAGVIAAEGSRDHMARTDMAGGRVAYARALYAQAFERPPPVMAEEFLRDAEADRDPALAIPRDVKVFAVGGHAGLIRMYDRNAAQGRRSLACYDRAGHRQPASLKGWPDAAAEAAVPPGWEALIELAERLSRALPWLLRFDFYLTDRGPVFGEITTYPNAGLGLTPFGRRTLLQMWEIWPDGTEQAPPA